MTPCLRLDDYLDGRLSESETDAFEAHAVDCDACEDALSLATTLAPLAAITCPPEVLDRASRIARQAPDRAPARRRSRVDAWAPLALAAALAVVLAVAFWPSPGSAPAPLATATPAPAATPTVPDTPLTPSLVPDVDASAEDARPEVVPAPPVREGRRSRPAPPAPVAPTPEAPSQPLPDTLPDVDEPGTEALAEAQPTAEEVEAARRDLALAFSLVADAQNRARDAVRAEATPLSTTIDHALPF